MSYDTSRFDDAAITRMLGHFQTLLEGIVANPSVPVNVQFVPGNHVTIMIQPHVQLLAERLRACINQAQTNI